MSIDEVAIRFDEVMARLMLKIDFSRHFSSDRISRIMGYFSQ